jgi:parallel beta-helix repeat protein
MELGVEGKYCLHFHKLKDCPSNKCLYKNNAIENSHARGIIVHGTHLSEVENNVLYNVRGAGIYLEDGNEMYNQIAYNVIICNFPFNHPQLHGCTIPGTSNGIADTSDNQSGIYSRAATNDLIGNRAANSFNGMLLQALGMGRGTDNNGKVCEADAKIGNWIGNTFHSHGRFGTYSLGSNYPKVTDQIVSADGHNTDLGLCYGFDSNGNTRGLPMAIIENLDYGNAFVGHVSIDHQVFLYLLLKYSHSDTNNR